MFRRRDGGRWPLTWIKVDGRLFVDVSELIAWLGGNGVKVTTLSRRAAEVDAELPAAPDRPPAPIVPLRRVTANRR